MNAQALLEKAARLVASLPDRLARRPVVHTEHMGTRSIISASQAQALGARLYLPDDEQVLLIEGDVHVSGPINRDWARRLFRETAGETSTSRLDAILITGELRVAGDIVDDDYLCLAVLGKLACDYLYSENGQMDVHGKLWATYGVYGEYNDGYLQVYGGLDAPFLFSNDHAMPRESADGASICLDNGEGDEIDSIRILQSSEDFDTYFEDGGLMLADAVWEGGFPDGTLSVERFFDLLRQGQNPFVDFAQYQQRLAQWEALQEERAAEAEEEKEEAIQPLEQLLYLQALGRSDTELCEQTIARAQQLLKKPDAPGKYGMEFFELLEVFGQMRANWLEIRARYSEAQKTDIARHAALLGDAWGRHLLAREASQRDERQLAMAYDFLSNSTSEGENRIHETTVLLGLALHKEHEAYVLLRILDKHLPEILDDCPALPAIIASAAYRAWLEKQ